MTFALTKIQPPRPRPGSLVRPRLDALLSQALTTQRMVLVCAPAGFGKTVVLSRCLAELEAGVASAWVSIDDDDDLVRFLDCLASALEPYDLPWRVSPDALAAMESQPHGLRRIADELLNALAGAEVRRGVLVFDDAHRLGDPRVLALVDLMLEGLPQGWTIVWSSRVEPTLALARLRVGGDLTELRQADLEFTVSEAEQWVQQSGRMLAPSQLRGWHERTRGWAAGLRLCMDSPGALAQAGGGAGAGAAVPQRRLFDYLASEVLAQMPAALRLFLMRCSVLPEMNAPKCAAVTEDPQSARWLAEVDRRGLFVTVLEAQELTLRLHDLFRDFLEDRLRAERPEEWPLLLQRAAGAEADPVRRVGLLLRAGAWDSAQAVLADAAPGMLLSGASSHVVQLIDQFPPAQRERFPRLALTRGLAAWLRYEWGTMHDSMARAAAGFDATQEAPSALRCRAFSAVALAAQGRIAEASALMVQVRTQPLEPELQALSELMLYWETGIHGPVEGPARHLGKMVDHLSLGAPPHLWLRCAPQSHFMFIGRQGVRDPMRRFVAGARAAAGESQVPLRAAADLLDAWLALWQARMEEAHSLVRSVAEDSRWLGHPRSLQVSTRVFAVVYHNLRGELQPVLEASKALLDDVDTDASRRGAWRGVYLYGQARACAALDEWGVVRDTLAELDRMPTAMEWPYMQIARGALRGWLALHDEKLEQAWQCLAPALERSHALDRFGLDALQRIVSARVQVRRAGPSAAAGILAPLLEQVRTSDEPTGVLMTGPTGLSHLARIAWGSHLSREDQALLERLAATARQLRVSPPAAGATSAAPPAPAKAALSNLSERELEVLRCIAAGDSNKVIARTFDLSPNTVKRHVSNILDKLALSSRGQAAAWYRQQG